MSQAYVVATYLMERQGKERFKLCETCAFLPEYGDCRKEFFVPPKLYPSPCVGCLRAAKQ